MAQKTRLKTDFQAVIFDMDGVIVDSEPLHAQHLEKFLTKLGVKDPSKVQIVVKGRRAQDTWAKLIDDLQLNYQIDEMVLMSRQHYLDHLLSLPEIPAIVGAAELINYLHQSGYKLALASSASPQRIDLFLNKLKLKHYFSVIISADDVTKSKPEPDIFLLAAQRLGIHPKFCLVIEDAQNGVRAAKAAGMQCVAYGGSDHNTDDLTEAGLIVTDFEALVKFLQRKSSK